MVVNVGAREEMGGSKRERWPWSVMVAGARAGWVEGE